MGTKGTPVEECDGNEGDALGGDEMGAARAPVEETQWEPRELPWKEDDGNEASAL